MVQNQARIQDFGQGAQWSFDPNRAQRSFDPKGAQWSFDPKEGGRSWAQNLLKIGVFPLKLPENCMILKKSWGQGGPPVDPLLKIHFWTIWEWPYSTKANQPIDSNKARMVALIGAHTQNPDTRSHQIRDPICFARIRPPPPTRGSVWITPLRPWPFHRKSAGTRTQFYPELSYLKHLVLWIPFFCWPQRSWTGSCLTKFCIIFWSNPNPPQRAVQAIFITPERPRLFPPEIRKDLATIWSFDNSGVFGLDLVSPNSASELGTGYLLKSSLPFGQQLGIQEKKVQQKTGFLVGSDGYNGLHKFKINFSSWLIWILLSSCISEIENVSKKLFELFMVQIDHFKKALCCTGTFPLNFKK